MAVLDEVLSANEQYASSFGAKGELALPPARRFAILTCMDARLDPAKYAGLSEGDAHVIRNAGGVITDDVIRSLCVSQRALGTREVILLHHTNCGLQNVSDDAFKASLERETGIKPWWSLESFVDPYTDVAQSMRRLELSPFIAHKDHIRGFVYEVETGLLHEVSRGD
jgi:carbonic anhydrase